MAKKKQDTPEMQLANLSLAIQACESTIESYRQFISERERLIKEKTEEIAQFQKLMGPLKIELLNESASSEAPLIAEWVASLATERVGDCYYLGDRLYIDMFTVPFAHMLDGSNNVCLRELATKSDLVALIRGLGYEVCGITPG